MITIARVPVAEVVASKELIAEYAAECSIPAIGEINPQGDAYGAMEQSGLLRSFIVYEDGEKVGFANLLTPVLPHYGERVATIESIFIRSGSSGGIDLIRELERYAKEAGCVGALGSAPVGGRLERFFEASKEYQRTNSVFYRRLA